MTEFKKIELSDVSEISQYLKFQNFGLCDFTAPTLYMWRDYFETQFLIKDGFLFLRHENFEGKRAYFYPLGKNDILPALNLIYEYEIQECGNKNLDFCLVPKEKCEEIAAFFHKKCPHTRVSITSDSNWDDYIYLKDEISGFPGKKLHGQKNHLNFFNKTFTDCKYVELTPQNIHLLKKFVTDSGLNEDANEIEKAEYEGLIEYLDNFNFFPDSFGGYLTVSEKIVAFAIAEFSGEYLIIHNEKADKSYRGAYQKIFDCIMKHKADENIKYINREEDCGDEGLRYAKNAYHPHDLLKKCTVSFSGF